MLSSSRWDDDFSSSALSLAKEFAKHNRVFYIDHPLSVKDFLSVKNRRIIKARRTALLLGKNSFKNIKDFPPGFTAVTPMLTIPANWLSEGKLYDFLSNVNDKILHQTLRKTIKKYRIKNYIFINIFDPFFFKSFPNDLKPALTIYQTVDDISQEKYIARHGVYLERKAIVKADFSFATSRELLRLTSAFSNRVHYLPNAADNTIFKKAVNMVFAKPVELRNVTGKVICYTGVIGTRINYELLKEIAVTHINKTLLLVGPTGTDDYRKAGLHNCKNVVFTGPKNIHELPAYLQHADVAIIPFEYSQLTKSIYPLKINEYLAAGKPVVSTAFSDDIKTFRDVAYIADTNKEFIEYIDVAIQENTVEKRMARTRKAETNTWKNRVETFWNIIEAESDVNVAEVTPISIREFS
jgi:glycosyltransferase involved in cell wall biosynthesis